GIRDTDGLVQSIQNAMNEQKEGSSQIIQALRDMNDSTSQVNSASKEMSEGNSHILKQVEDLKLSADKMKVFIDSMDASAMLIDKSSSELVDISSKVRDAISLIGSQIDQFEV
ncbi:MAG: methyl-accepting chemotaxis protein, partial [Treponema sp.]|nr:methyl-accepting chemotaxis protein [Treponema sp.]